MTPNLTLFLSQTAITLSHDTPQGWRPVHDVDPASETLARDLDELRQTAEALEPNGVRCKLIIPDEQVRYLTLQTPGLDESARRVAAGKALEEATPYDLADLVFDINIDGDETHVAGVARETLDEAETFAGEHQLHPVCFAAPQKEGLFSKEPSFGPASSLVPPARVTTAHDLAAEDQSRDIRSSDKQDLDPENAEQIQPSFVSRRRVPTFRTTPPERLDYNTSNAEGPRGFSEPPAPFKGAPKRAPAKPDPSPALPAPGAMVRKPSTEADRFTVFGAADGAAGSGRMGSAGLLIVAFVVLFAGVAAFASGILGTNVTAYFDRLTKPEPVAQFTTPLEPEAKIEPPTALLPQADLASLQQDLTDEDAAVLDALRAPETEPTDLPVVEEGPSNEVTGIWTDPPTVPVAPPLVDLDDLYVTSIDPINMNFDAVALPMVTQERNDLAYLAPPSPAPAGTLFDLDERGLVVATPDGALNADGILIFAKPPGAKPPLNLLKTEDPDVNLTERLRLVAFRPQARPSDLIETSERATFSGLTRSELSEMRPRLRPQSAQETARETTLAAASLVQLDSDGSQSIFENSEDGAIENATSRAVAASLRPDARPSNFTDTVAQAKSVAPPVVTASTAVVAPRVVAPRIPSSASTTQEATVKNAINLRKVNLIGVYGKPSDRRALVRMSNGSYRKVQVGDRMDGGQVSAIGDAELRYQKRGRDIVLKMPRG